VENDLAVVREFFEKLPRARVAIEATGSWWWLVDLLEELGHKPVLSHPKETKAIAHARLKNDRVDAERLADLCRGGLLPTVWIPPMSVREARELIRHRVSLVWHRTRVKNGLTSLLARRNLRRSESRSWYTQEGVQEMRQLSLSPIPSRVRDDALVLLRVLGHQIRRVEKQILDTWGDDPIIRRLATIPGIGWFTSTALVLELGQIRRFPSAKHLASYVGLTPRVKASGGRVRTGHISKEGNRILRWLLVSAATQATRRPGPLRNWYRRLQRRKGKKIARVALARRLTEIVYQCWKERIDYWEFLCRQGVRG